VLYIGRIRKSLRWENWRVYLDSSKDPWCCSRMRARMAREHVRLPILTASLVTVVGTDMRSIRKSGLRWLARNGNRVTAPPERSCC
jgi:hypothetical protein